MSKNLKKVVMLALIVAVLGSLFIGCGSNQQSSENTTLSSGNTTESAASTATGTTAPEPVTLTNLTGTDPDYDSMVGGDPNKTPFWSEFTRLTGITYDYIFVSPQELAEKFKLLLASGDMPDVFAGQLNVDYAGGIPKAIEDKVIAPVNPYLDTICKDYKKVLESNPEYMRNAKDDSGMIPGFAALRTDKSVIYGGPMIRKDLLDKAGITKLPVTIDDWYTDLKAIKDAGYSSPLTIQFHWKLEEGAFVGAYGVTGNYAIGADNKVHFTATEPGYKEFLKTFAQWYKDGLIDPDFFTVADPSLFAAKMTDMKTSGAGMANVSRIQMTNSAGKEIDPDYNVVGVQYPVLKEGDEVLYGQKDYPVDLRWYVNGQSKKIEDAMRGYNFLYTDEGIALTNWGIKDLTYTEADGKKQFTEEIPLGGAKANSKGWSMDQALKMYIQMAVDSCGVEDGDSFAALRFAYPGQGEAVTAWSNFKIIYKLPESLSYTDTETAVMKMEQNLYENVVRAWRMKFIMGNVPITDENWQKYVDECNKMGAEAILKVKNDAYARYLSR